MTGPDHPKARMFREATDVKGLGGVAPKPQTRMALPLVKECVGIPERGCLQHSNPAPPTLIFPSPGVGRGTAARPPTASGQRSPDHRPCEYRSYRRYGPTPEGFPRPPCQRPVRREHWRHWPSVALCQWLPRPQSGTGSLSPDLSGRVQRLYRQPVAPARRRESPARSYPARA